MSPYLNYRGTFANSGGDTKSIRSLPVKLNTVFGKFLFIFLFKFELNVDSFDSEVVSAIAVVFNLPAN